MNADPQVMRYFPSTLTAEETDALLGRISLHFEQHGFGLWAVVDKATGEFAGYIGLAVPSFEAYFTSCVEIGWRLAARFWNRGLATEGAASVFTVRVRNSATRRSRLIHDRHQSNRRDA
jgi:RimJ/RimL family protein N-acetyltransferase